MWKTHKIKVGLNYWGSMCVMYNTGQTMAKTHGYVHVICSHDYSMIKSLILMMINYQHKPLISTKSL